MPKIIDHKERKELIVKTALKLFAEKGEKETSLSLIAEKSKLSRGTVYQYFHNIKDIYSYAVKQVSDAALSKYTSGDWIAMDKIIDSIKKTALDVLEIADAFMADIINLIKALPSINLNLPEEIKRRTAKIRFAVNRALRHGIKTGQVKQCNTDEAVETIMSLIGSYCFQSAYFPEFAKHIKTVLEKYISSLKISP